MREMCRCQSDCYPSCVDRKQRYTGGESVGPIKYIDITMRKAVLTHVVYWRCTTANQAWAFLTRSALKKLQIPFPLNKKLPLLADPELNSRTNAGRIERFRTSLHFPPCCMTTLLQGCIGSPIIEHVSPSRQCHKVKSNP